MITFLQLADLADEWLTMLLVLALILLILLALAIAVGFIIRSWLEER